MRSRVWVVAVAAVAVLLVGTLFAQQPPGGRGMGRGREQMTEEERAQRWEQMQERRLARLRERLEVSDEEWGVLSEPIKALNALRRDEFTASRRLRETVEAEGATTEQLKQALDQYRKTMKEIAERRTKLQAQLKELVSLKQEVILVLEGILE